MDSDRRAALAGFVRAELGADLDELAGEITLLRRRLAAVEAVANVPAAPEERRERAAELRMQGLSVRSIALVLRSHRATIQSDLEAAGVFPPGGQVVGADGRTTRPRLQPPAA